MNTTTYITMIGVAVGIYYFMKQKADTEPKHLTDDVILKTDRLPVAKRENNLWADAHDPIETLKMKSDIFHRDIPPPFI